MSHYFPLLFFFFSKEGSFFEKHLNFLTSCISVCMLLLGIPACSQRSLCVYVCMCCALMHMCARMTFQHYVFKSDKVICVKKKSKGSSREK